MNWDSLYERKICPPFKPNVIKKDDVKHIDNGFLNEEISDTPTEKAPLANANNFPGFTYNEEAIKMKQEESVKPI